MPGWPIVIVSSQPTSGTGPSLLQLQRWLAKELGFYLPTTVTTQATGGDATRVVIADEIRDDEENYAFLGRQWVYVRSGAQAGTQRRILDHPEAGYQGSRSAALVSRPFSSALLTGAVLEFTSPLPVKSHLGIDGLTDCINQALELIRVQSRLTVTGNGTYQHDISAYPILEAWQIVGISDSLLGLGLPPQESPYRPELVVDGVSRTLVTQLAYGTSQTFYLDVIVPADRLIYNGSAWALVPQNGTPGLLGDTYQTAAPESWVHAFAMREALEAVIDLVEASPNLPDAEKDRRVRRLQERSRTRALAAQRIKVRQFPRPRPQPRDSMTVAARMQPLRTPASNWP